jgi:hypothetical protein
MRPLLRLWLFIAALAASAAEDAAYLKVITERADKIVAPLALGDAAKTARVRDVIVRHYRDLNAIHQARDAKLATVKSAAAATAAARAEAEEKITPVHRAFLEKLAADLTPAQIDQVKDGLTYGVLPKTYAVYLEMLPQLTAAQKAQIMAWLVEAREHAVDGSTSDEKHAWFGKYKGRINNFLAAAGFDLKQAEKEMLARQKAAPAAK